MKRFARIVKRFAEIVLFILAVTAMTAAVIAAMVLWLSGLVLTTLEETSSWQLFDANETEDEIDDDNELLQSAEET